MPFTQEIFIEARHARVEAHGDFDLDEAVAAFERVVQAVAEHQLETVLYDALAVSGSIPDHERFLYGTRVAAAITAHTQTRHTRFAYVMRAPIRDPGRLGEMAATNRGMQVRTFENAARAMAWLRTAREPEPW